MFLSYEWQRSAMERSLKTVLPKYRLLSSFREPLSHFFSACIHNAMVSTLNGSSYHLRKTVDDLKVGKRMPGRYFLVNFQTSYVVNSSVNSAMLKSESSREVLVAMAKEYIKRMYWYSIAEHMSLSLSLLQCQVFGEVKPELLADAARLPKLNDHSKSHELLHVNSGLLNDIHSLIKTDTVVYEMILQDFWQRIDLHKDCLRASKGTADLFLLS